MADFLFELGMEEVPAGSVADILTQLKTAFKAKLDEHAIRFEHLEGAATNRRFMIHITQMDEKGQDKVEIITGPSKKIAYDAEGKHTVALQKFAVSNQIQIRDVLEIETPKGTYISTRKVISGESTAELLARLVPKILGELEFPKKMVWNDSRVPFIRPIKTLLVLFKELLVECEFADIKSANLIQGHQLLSSSDLEVHSYKEYIEHLAKNFIVVNETERLQKITDEIKDFEGDSQVHVQTDAEMLDYYLYSNEYPVVFNGAFAPKYLDLPAEIISTFMVHEKKLLPVYDQNNALTTHFIGVANIPDENHKIVRGNEKVIQAAFEDARFFWDKDRAENFMDLADQLRNVMFQKDLGNYLEKSQRLTALVDFIARETDQASQITDLLTAAKHCKNDLLTRMVREFPSLQGIMGGLYLKEAGAAENVWQAVYSQYSPKGYTTEKLTNVGAGILSLADRIDNIAAFLSKGAKISSSKDPYGIRRDANAIIKIVVDFELDFELEALIRMAGLHFVKDDDELKKLQTAIEGLFKSRLENVFKDHLQFRYDVVGSVLHNARLNIHRLQCRAEAVTKMLAVSGIQDIIAVHKRLRNIIRNTKESYKVSPSLLQDKEEKVLHEIFKEAKGEITNLIMRKQYLDAGAKFLEMKPVIDAFFDKVLVMAEDEKVKKNRIGLLQKLDELLAEVADFSLIVENESRRST